MRTVYALRKRGCIDLIDVFAKVCDIDEEQVK
jgi:hypothetical protein